MNDELDAGAGGGPRPGVPVISSNAALIRHLLALAGQDGTGRGPWRLFAVRSPIAEAAQQ